MSNTPLLESLKQEMQASAFDIKAEAMLLLAIEKGLSVEDFIVAGDKIFNREYSSDVVSSELKEDSRKQNYLHIHLSRSGFYDQLPEGLFFQLSERGNRGSRVSDMATDYKLNKKKEEEIRRFFLPFENDFFLQRVNLEREETVLLEGLKSGILNEYFIQFWDLPDSIPRQFVIPLILLLPHAFKIVGDMELTAQCLQQLLREPVNVCREEGKPEVTSGIFFPVLSEGRLGQDMVCGEEFWDGTPIMKFEIGPLRYSKISDYLFGGRRYDLVETFNRFFVPAGMDVEIEIVVSDDEQNMMLEKGAEPVMGYSTTLGY
jgi:hypothetical protein